jgi:hypothetical protein
MRRQEIYLNWAITDQWAKISGLNFDSKTPVNSLKANKKSMEPLVRIELTTSSLPRTIKSAV